MRSWLPVILATLFILCWALLIQHLIGDRPRDWDYMTTPYIPAESLYSSEQPAARPDVPRQIPPIPQPRRKAP